MLSAALFALTIAFPVPGSQLPPIERCYMIGAVSRGVTNLVVQGQQVEIYRTGAWATMLEVSPGSNSVEVVESGGERATIANWCFRVERARKPSAVEGAQPGAITNAVKAVEKTYSKLAYADDTAQAHPQGKKPEEILIVVDPGHGGPKDLGARSPHNFFEKDANLAVAKEFRRALEELGFRVELTREDDQALPLLERAHPAHEKKADAFISIHHNAPAADKDPRQTRYSSVYCWNPLGERLAKALSKQLAQALEGDIPDHGVLHANFAVTRSPQIPSCLVEIDFLTSPQGEEAIWDAPRRRKIAVALAQGVLDWIK